MPKHKSRPATSNSIAATNPVRGIFEVSNMQADARFDEFLTCIETMTSPQQQVMLQRFLVGLVERMPAPEILVLREKLLGRFAKSKKRDALIEILDGGLNSKSPPN